VQDVLNKDVLRREMMEIVSVSFRFASPLKAYSVHAAYCLKDGY